MEETERLSWIGIQLEVLAMKSRFRGKLGLYDHHIIMEDVACKLLNLVYGWQLVNLNHRIKNHPAIDLGDENKRIAVQVTSDGTRRKISETLQKFKQHNFGQKYDWLIIFVHGVKAGKEKDLISQRDKGLPRIQIIDMDILYDAKEESAPGR